jgi:tetratricopeptide (TPR) repeat protein
MPDFDDLDKLGNLDDLGDLDHISFDDPAPAPPARSASGLGAVIQDLMARRNFQQVLQIASSQQDAVARDPQVAAMVQSARAQLEQEAFLQNFLDGARSALAAGQIDKARAYYEKARALDPHHPDVAAFARQAQAASPARPAAAAPAAYAPPAPARPAPAPLATFNPQDDLLSFDEPAARPAPSAYAPPPARPVSSQEDSFGDLSFDEGSFGAPTGSPAASGGGASFGSFGSEPSFGTEASFAPAAGGGHPSSFGTEASFGGSSFDELEGAFGSTPEPAGPSVYQTGFGEDGDAEGGGNRIRELLNEGQTFFEREEYQNAIDVWSRIFLIDIENQEASNRIEAARGKKAERERQAEELFHRAGDQIEKGSFEEAKNTLAQVLVLQPGHSSARDYLEQLHAGKVPTIRREDPAALDLLDDGGFGDLQKAAGVKEVGHTLEAAVARDRVVVVKRTDRRLIAAAAAGAIVVIGTIYFLVTKWDSLFPNAESAAATSAPVKTGSLERAKKVFEAGKVENAIQLLERVPPEDEGYKEAQTLITQWKAMVKSGTPEDAGPSPELAARRQRMVEAAREMHKQRQYLRSRKLLERANKIMPLEGADLALKQDADGRLSDLSQEIALFAEGSYEQMLPDLWRKHDANPQDLDVLNLIVDAYYNLAVADLQRGLPEGASQKLKEAVGLAQGNEELLRLKLFADSYAQRSQDLLYRIYVKYLPTRS